MFTKGEVWSSEALVVSRFKGIDATYIYICPWSELTLNFTFYIKVMRFEGVIQPLRFNF